jgi:hypothetical protein
MDASPSVAYFGAREQAEVMTLDVVEFIRRFLLHILPCGFVKTRHYGFLANGVRTRRLELCRSLLPGRVRYRPTDAGTASRHPPCCPACGAGRMVLIGIISATQLLAMSTAQEVNTS